MKIRVHISDIPAATSRQTNKIIRELNVKKATGANKIPSKIIKLSANITDAHLTNVINSDLLKDSFSEGPKNSICKTCFQKEGTR